MQSNMNDFGWSFCVCPPHAIKSWFSSCHISDTVTKSNFIWDVCVYFELWSLKYSGEMIKNQQHHRLQQTLQIILLGPCTQPPPSPPPLYIFFLVEPHYPCYLRLPLWSGRGFVTSHSLLCQLAGGGENEGGRRRNTSGGFPTHGRPGQLSSDSLFCNCPHGLLSSLERR